jgi:hypothetical protein
MLRKNNISTGLLVGLLLPVAGWVFFNALFDLLEMKNLASSEGFSQNFRERTLAIVAIALNLMPLNFYRRIRADQAMRGVVLATGLMALIWLGRYGVGLF